jgi:hypothetical protein
MAAATRRGLLAASGLLAGAGAVVGIDGAAQAAPVRSGAGVLPAGLQCRNLRLARLGGEPGKLAPLRTSPLPYGDLVAADGSPCGRFDTSVVAGRREPLHLHRFELDGGTLVGLGTASLDGEFTIVGASGDLAGAAGSYLVRRHGDVVDISFLDPKAV